MAKPSNNARIALKDVSNRFNEKCSKHAKAVKSHKRDVSTIYSLESDLNSKAKATTKSVENKCIPLISQSGESKKNSAKSSKSFQSKLPQPTTLALASKSPTIYQDGPAHDIDKRDADDPYCATAYVQDMYKYFKEQEHRAVVGPYMDDQLNINAKMRAILIDWLASIHHKMKCDPETLYLTVNIIDRYLAKTQAARKSLQLIGVTALLIASKYEQIYPVDTNDLVYVCDKLYTCDEIFGYEEKMLKTLNYQISIPTMYKFLIRYLNAGHADKKLVYLSSYILEESLLSYDMIKYKPSQLAAAAVLIGRHSVGRNNWSPTLLKYSDYREEDVIGVARDMLAAKNSLWPGLDH
ncbi:hypothetical protein ACHAXR_001363, partial [Thalassiosira sp. AJA248-18]